MRLFIAVNFSPRFRAALVELTQGLSAQAVFCRATPPENHHLTLAFIGESEGAEEIRRLLQPSLGPAFTLVTSRLGCFRRSGGDICWLGVEGQPCLLALQADIQKRLLSAGFALPQRAFRPHLTLLRQAAFPPGFDLAAFGRGLPRLHERVCRVSLMASDLSSSRPLYRELYGQELE